MLAFVAHLIAKCPDLPTDDTPWTGGPLTGEIGGKFTPFWRHMVLVQQ
jgi:hypothetical protein